MYVTETIARSQHLERLGEADLKARLVLARTL